MEIILDPALVPVVFQLKNFKCPKNLKPAITGDIYELGEWELDRAIIASPSIYDDTDSETEDDGKENERKDGDVKEYYKAESDYKEKDENEEEYDDQVWICEVKLPMATEFEWNWALVSRDETRAIFFDVEQTVRRKDCVGYYKKNFPSMWEMASVHPNHIKVKECDVKISLLEKKVNKNQRVCLLGSVPAMGCWIPTRSILATRLGENSNQWDVQLKLPLKSRPVYWKWAVINVKTQKIAEWESRMDRTLHVRTDYLALKSFWNENCEASVITARDYPNVKEKSQNETGGSGKLFKPVIDPDLTQPPALYYEMMREIYKIYRALRPDGSVQYRRYKNMAYVERFPTLQTLVDITSNILQYRDAIVFQVTDGGGKRKNIRFAFRCSQFIALDYPDPDVLTEMSFSYLMRYLSDSPQYYIGPPIIPYENEKTKKDKMTAWIKRSYYNKKTNVKIEFVLKPEADYLCVEPPDISPHKCSTHPKNMRPKADADNWSESIAHSELKEKRSIKKIGHPEFPPSKVTKGTQTRWTNRPSINQINAASQYKHKHSPVKFAETTKILLTAEKQTDTEGLYQTNIDTTEMKGQSQYGTEKSQIESLQLSSTDSAKLHILQKAHQTVFEQKAAIEKGKGKSLCQNITEKLGSLYQTCSGKVRNEEFNQTYNEVYLVNVGLYQTDVDTGKGERFYKRNISQKHKENENYHQNDDLHETNIDTEKRESYVPKNNSLLFNLAYSTLRNIFS
ncbi:hypothetical protein LOTGIDRAFT_160912 [Lottia gigantea]|uniref:CBM20 domain-containing protein n=1 Tax=Lottia gigantea TaxID=225164 RepID=V3ZUI5_LOTGI|nr:hypothetical protein LOTGIDRAFT_160912 [Lottia gigantea]ESO95148.1 hypothetical protein LOTGIDRAFT_160912 [Lottia gigantea]